MDLLTTVRKEGSRGGRGDFKWSDVQASTHRENYLGHSLMAPVGRWSKGKDLTWYAKGDSEKQEGETDADRATRERKEEIKLVKEAEQDALARALGFEVAPRNPNMEALGDKKEVDRVLKEAVEDEGGQGGKGVGFGSLGAGGPKQQFGDDERIEGNAEGQDAELGNALREYKRRHGDDAESKRKTETEIEIGSIGEGQDRGKITEADVPAQGRGPKVAIGDLVEIQSLTEAPDEEVGTMIAVDRLTKGGMAETITIGVTTMIGEDDPTTASALNALHSVGNWCSTTRSQRGQHGNGRTKHDLV